MKKLIITACLILIFGICVVLILLSEQKSATKTTSIIEGQINQANQFINSQQLDSAYHVLQILLAEIPNSQKDTDLQDSARILKTEFEILAELESREVYLRLLLEMTDEEYEHLRQNKLQKHFLTNPVLNAYYLESLYQKSSGEEGLNQDNSLISEESDSLSIRKEYENKLQSSFQQLGFDINVSVSGQNNATLILTSSAFDDTWFEKFQSSGDMDEWHRLGFSTVKISNGNNFHKSVSRQ